MPITRTPIIDDSGQGTDGTVIDNAWKQQLYDQIDAFTAGAVLPVYGTFTPTDASGAGLVFPTKSASYALINKLMVVWMEVVFPATGSGLSVSIGGLPFPSVAGTKGGFYSGYGVPACVWHLGGGLTNLFAMDPASMAQRTNAQLSGSTHVMIGTYRAQ